MSAAHAIVGRCIGCGHDFRTGDCGGCGAVPGPHEKRCDGDDTVMCALCASGDPNLMCLDCCAYAAEDAEPLIDRPSR